MPIERYVPQLVFDRLIEDIPRDQLIKILYWIAMHPERRRRLGGRQSQAARADEWPVRHVGETRGRSMVYALKLLGRLVGKIKKSFRQLEQFSHVGSVGM